MDGRDDQLKQQVFDAFGSVSMNEEAQLRILSNLKDRQAQLADERENVEAPKTTALPRAQAASECEADAHLAEVVQVPRRKSLALRLLPLAAVLAVAIVVVRMVAMPSPRYDIPSESAVAVTEQTKDTADSAEGLGVDSVAEGEAYDVASDEGASLSSEESEPRIMSTVDLYPIVEMDDGTVLSVLIDGLYTQQLDVSQVGNLIGTAVARPSDAGDTVDCKVFRLVDDTEGYAVCYEGEDTYWYCVRVDVTQ